MFQFTKSLKLFSGAVLACAALSACDDDDDKGAELLDAASQQGEGGTGGNAGAGAQGEGGTGGNAGAGAQGEGGTGGNAGEGAQGGSTQECNTVEDCPKGNLCQIVSCDNGRCSSIQKQDCCTEETVTTDCTDVPPCFTVEGVRCEENTCVYARIPEDQPGACECRFNNDCSPGAYCEQNRCIPVTCSDFSSLTGMLTEQGNTQDGIARARIECVDQISHPFEGKMLFYRIEVPAKTAKIVTASEMETDLGLVQLESCESISCVNLSDHELLADESLTFINNEDAPQEFFFMIAGHAQEFAGHFTLNIQHVDCEPIDSCLESVCTERGSVCTQCIEGLGGEQCTECARDRHNVNQTGAELDCQPNDAEYACSETRLLQEGINRGDLTTAPYFGAIECTRPRNVTYRGNQQLHKLRLKPHTQAKVTALSAFPGMGIAQVSGCDDLTCIESTPEGFSNDNSIVFGNDNNDDLNLFLMVTSEEENAAETYALNIETECLAGYLNQEVGGNSYCIVKTPCNAIQEIQPNDRIEGNTFESFLFTDISCGSDSNDRYLGGKDFYTYKAPPRSITRMVLKNFSEGLHIGQIASCTDLTCNKQSKFVTEQEQDLFFINESAEEQFFYFFVGSPIPIDEGHYQLIAELHDYYAHCEALSNLPTGPVCFRCENGYSGDQCERCAEGFYEQITAAAFTCVNELSCTAVREISETHLEGDLSQSPYSDEITYRGILTFNGPKDVYTLTVPAYNDVTVNLSGLTSDLALISIDDCAGMHLDQISDNSGTADESLTFNNNSYLPFTYTFYVATHTESEAGPYQIDVVNNECASDMIQHCASPYCSISGLICPECDEGYESERCNYCAQGWHSVPSSFGTICARNTGCDTIVTLNENHISGDTTDGVSYSNVFCEGLDGPISGHQNFYTLSTSINTTTTVILTNLQDDLTLVKVDSCNHPACISASDNSGTQDEYITFINDTGSQEWPTFMVASKDATINSSYELRLLSCYGSYIQNCKGEIGCSDQGLICSECNEHFMGNKCDACEPGYHMIDYHEQTICHSECGDGITTPDEDCDRGSNEGGLYQGCSSSCTPNPGYTCVRRPGETPDFRCTLTTSK